MIYWLVFLSVFISYAVGSILNQKGLPPVAAWFVVALESAIVTAWFALLSWLVAL